MVCSVLPSGVVTWDHQSTGPAPCLYTVGVQQSELCCRETPAFCCPHIHQPRVRPLPPALKVTGGISLSKAPIHACTSSPSSASSGPYSDHSFHTHFFEKID